MAIKISAHKKEAETQPPEPVIASVAEEPEQPAGWVPVSSVSQDEYTGEKAPVFLRIWMAYMVFASVISAIIYLGDAQSFGDAMLFLALPVLCYGLPLVLALVRSNSVRFIFPGMVTAVVINAFRSNDFGAINSFFGLSLVVFALYIFFSAKVKIYLSYGKQLGISAGIKPNRKLIVFLLAVFAVFSFAFAVIQAQTVSSLQNDVAEIEEKYSNALNQKSAALENITSLQKEVTSLKSELWNLKQDHAKLQTSSAKMLTDLAMYEDNVAFVNNYYGNCAYHTISCNNLAQTFYVTTVHGAKSQGCWACSACH